MSRLRNKTSDIRSEVEALALTADHLGRSLDFLIKNEFIMMMMMMMNSVMYLRYLGTSMTQSNVSV